MENKKQSSVEWLIGCIAEDQMLKAKSLNEWFEIFEQAKEMHQKEIEDAYNAVIIDENGGLLDGKEYYKETFGGQDNE